MEKALWVAKARTALAKGDYLNPMFSKSRATRLIRRVAAELHLIRTTEPTKRRRLCRTSEAGPVLTVAVAQSTIATETTPNTPQQRLGAYLQLLAHLNTAPWASGQFGANTGVMMRLVAAHLPLIVGEKNPHPSLYAMIDGSGKLAAAQNVVWITNRQQGKTTLIGKFIASLVLTAQCGGVLACVYSTKMDRAAELCKAAKEYIHWMATPGGAFSGCPSVSFELDNQRQFTIRVGTHLPVSVMARPRNADACRGDAPAAAFFDEIAFTSSAFWYQFALPLLQVAGRRFTCTTTPPPAGSFFDNFCKEVKAANATGDAFFYLLNHSLACEECIEALEPDKCCHKLYLVPPWKSLISLNAIGRLMPKSRRADFVAEVFGVMRTEFNGYLPKVMVEKVFRTNKRLCSPPCDEADLVVWLAVDPCSHGRSEMGLTAIVSGGGGQIVVIGAASVNGARCQIKELQSTVSRFARKVRAHPWVGPYTVIVPIIECNNNEIAAASLLSALKPFGPLFVPFTAPRFENYVTPGVGVWTTESTTAAALSTFYQIMVENRIAVAAEVVTVGREAFHPKAQEPSVDSMLALAADQLTQFHDDHNGKVTGKTTDGLQDDLGMAMLLCVYWRLATLAADPSISG